ncbi:MAG: hypothetical protein MUE94_12275 [Verrucomicrobia bacterium]|nr:hypothetical protein [Verrucomicrobiota bacterium]
MRERTDNDRSAELQPRHSAGAQHIAHLVPAAQVGAEFLPVVAQSAGMDDPPAVKVAG